MGKKKSVVLMVLLTIVIVVFSVVTLVPFPIFGTPQSFNPTIWQYDLGADLGGGYYAYYYPEGVKTELEMEADEEDKADYIQNGSLYLSKDEQYGLVKDGAISQTFKTDFAKAAKAIATRFENKGYSDYRVAVVDDYAIRVEVPSSDATVSETLTIFNYTGATPPNPADWGVYIAANTTLDTQGHTVTWTAGAVINMSSTFTKAGEGTLVMEPRGATYEGEGNAVVVAGGTLEARACTLSGAATWSSVFGGVPVTVKDGATLRIASGVTSVSNAVTLEEGSTLVIQSITSRSSGAASVGALTATGPATVKISGTIPDSAMTDGVEISLSTSCDILTRANLTLDASELKFESGKVCKTAKFKVVKGLLLLSVKPEFCIKIR
jgi:hypothetical protein